MAKFLGFILGFVFLKSWVGAFLGLIIGAVIDSAKNKNADTEQNAQVQSLFMCVLFTAMGRLAKADGRVSEQEIAHAEQVIRQFAMDEEGRRKAIAWFQQGVKQEEGFYNLLAQFADASRRRPLMRQKLLEILLSQALVDRYLHPAEEDCLLEIAQALGVSALQFKVILARLKAQYHFSGQGQSSHYSDRPAKDLLQEAYEALGVKASDTDAQVKKAYRQRMSENHPDKLMAKGLPEAAIKQATERSQAIQQAYALIKKQRGLK